MIKEFEDNGYESGINLGGLSYDFRRNPNADFSRNLRKIVKMYYEVNKRKCTLIAYKYGGLMTLHSIASNKKYYETYVENIILISVPFGGQYSSIYEMETDAVLDSNIPSLLIYNGKKVLRDWESTLFSYLNHKHPEMNNVIYQKDTSSYTYVEFMKSLHPDIIEIIENNNLKYDKIFEYMSNNNQIKLACVTGKSTTFSTPGSVSVSSQVFSYNRIDGDGLTDIK
ncbi:hypothetical protein A3Q56_07876, partial [Intoshia linei]